MNSLQKDAITFLIPSRNGEKRIVNCIKSITKQHYPKKLITILVINDSSIDDTHKTAEGAGVQVFDVAFGDAQYSIKYGMTKLHTEYFIAFGDDEQLVSHDWVRLMIGPMKDNKRIVGSFTKFVVNRNDPAVSRLLAFDDLQRDPIYKPFTPDISETVVEKRDEYFLLEYSVDKIPPAGQCVWRTNLFQKSFITSRVKYMELDFLRLFVKHGYKHFAYVPDAKIYNPFVKNIAEVCRKRIRNIRKNYLRQPDPREYTWFDLNKPRDVVIIILWIIYAETFILPFLNGIRLALQHKDIAGLLEGPLVFAETNTILFEFAWQGLLFTVRKIRRGVKHVIC